MAVYTYQAKNNSGQIKSGSLEAQGKQEAAAKIDSLGLYLITLEEVASKTKIPSKVSLKELSEFTRQLSTLINSGSTILSSLHTLSVEMRHFRLQPVIVEVIFQVEQGVPFSDALKRHPNIFPEIYVSLVKVGETSGTLSQNLRRISQFLEEELEFKTNIVSIITYPLMVVGIAIVTIIVLLRFVIPKLVDIFQELGQTLPLATLILVNLSNFLSRYWVLIIIVFCVLGFILWEYFKIPKNKLSYHRSILRMPVFGELINKIEICRFSRTLSVLLNNGIPIDTSLRVITSTVSNVFLKNEINNIESKIKEGFSLSGTMRNTSIFSPSFVNVVTVGEVSGTLGDVLENISNDYNKEIDRKVKKLLSGIELFLIMGVGLVVGFVVLSMLLPIFQIDFNF